MHCSKSRYKLQVSWEIVVDKQIIHMVLNYDLNNKISITTSFTTNKILFGASRKTNHSDFCSLIPHFL